MEIITDELMIWRQLIHPFYLDRVLDILSIALNSILIRMPNHQ